MAAVTAAVPAPAGPQIRLPLSSQKTSSSLIRTPSSSLQLPSNYGERPSLPSSTTASTHDLVGGDNRGIGPFQSLGQFAVPPSARNLVAATSQQVSDKDQPQRIHGFYLLPRTANQQRCDSAADSSRSPARAVPRTAELGTSNSSSRLGGPAAVRGAQQGSTLADRVGLQSVPAPDQRQQWEPQRQQQVGQHRVAPHPTAFWQPDALASNSRATTTSPAREARPDRERFPAPPAKLEPCGRPRSYSRALSQPAPAQQVSASPSRQPVLPPQPASTPAQRLLPHGAHQVESAAKASVDEYLVDNSLLKSECDVLGYRRSPSLQDRAECSGAPFGSVVRGVVLTEADGLRWLFVSEGRFLPMTIKGKEVVRMKDAELQTHSSSRSPLGAKVGPQPESASDWKCERCSEMNLETNEACWLCKGDRPQAHRARCGSSSSATTEIPHTSKLEELEAELERAVKVAEQAKRDRSELLQAVKAAEDHNAELVRLAKEAESEKAELKRMATISEADKAERHRLMVRIEALEAANQEMELRQAQNPQMRENRERHVRDGTTKEQLKVANEELLSGLQARDQQIRALMEEREVIEELMSGEGSELRERIDQLTQDKERLNEKMARTLAKVEATTGGNNPELEMRFQEVSKEKETLKDELVLVQGQVVLLNNKLSIAERKLKLADSEILILQSELGPRNHGK